MIELNSLTEKTVDLAVAFGGVTVNCKIRPHAITGKFLKDLNAAEDEEAGYKLIEKVLSEWDISVDGKILPVTVENLLLVPEDFLASFLDAAKAKREEIKKQK